jgi:hypothetical protein
MNNLYMRSLEILHEGMRVDWRRKQKTKKKIIYGEK